MASRNSGGHVLKRKRMRTNSLLKTKFAKNASWIIASRIYQIVINLAVSMVSVRYLGPDNYGLINYAASFAALLTAFCTLGTNDVLVNELVTDPEREGSTLGTVIIFRLFSSALSMATICLLVAALSPNDKLALLVAAVYSSSLIFQSFEAINYWYQAKLLSKTTSIITSIARTVVGVYKIVLLITRKSVVWFAAANAVEYIVVGFLLLIMYRKNCAEGQKLSFSFSHGKDILSRSHHFILSGFMVALYTQMDIIMLRYFCGDRAVGFYSTAVTICALWNFVLSAIIDSARPVIFESYNNGDIGLYKKRLTQLYSAVVYISVAAAIVITALSRYIILILYGSAYLPAQNGLCILTWATLFSYLGVARSLWVVPHGQQVYEKYIAAVGVISNLIMNLIMIPRWGANGAAIATLLTQVISNCVCSVIFKPLRENGKLMLCSLDIGEYIKYAYSSVKTHLINK